MWFLGLLRFVRFWIFLAGFIGLIAVTLPIFIVVLVFIMALMLLY